MYDISFILTLLIICVILIIYVDRREKFAGDPDDTITPPNAQILGGISFSNGKPILNASLPTNTIPIQTMNSGPSISSVGSVSPISSNNVIMSDKSNNEIDTSKFDFSSLQSNAAKAYSDMDTASFNDSQTNPNIPLRTSVAICDLNCSDPGILKSAKNYFELDSPAKGMYLMIPQKYIKSGPNTCDITYNYAKRESPGVMDNSDTKRFTYYNYSACNWQAIGMGPVPN